MEAEAAKLVGAGLAAIGAGMAAIGVGNVFGSFLESALRNPGAADGQQGRLFIGFAAAELLVNKDFDDARGGFGHEGREHVAGIDERCGVPCIEALDKAVARGENAAFGGGHGRAFVDRLMRPVGTPTAETQVRGGVAGVSWFTFA